MQNEELEYALDIMEELGAIEMYEEAIRLIQHPDHDDLTIYDYDIKHFRYNTLKIIADAGRLSDTEIKRIQKVDAYILSHDVPHQLQELKDWLKNNAL